MRKVRSDCTVETFAKKHDLPEEIIRDPITNRKIRKDKTMGTIRKEKEERKRKK